MLPSYSEKTEHSLQRKMLYLRKNDWKLIYLKVTVIVVEWKTSTQTPFLKNVTENLLLNKLFNEIHFYELFTIKHNVEILFIIQNLCLIFQWLSKFRYKHKINFRLEMNKQYARYLERYYNNVIKYCSTVKIILKKK